MQTRTPLTRERVLEAAVALADSGGIAALTMRRLATELGVEAMSLYHHVANKDEILDGILDVVAGEIELPIDGGWKEATRVRAASAQEVLARHPWAGALWVSRLNLGPARMKYMDVALSTFRAGGLNERLTHHAYHVVENHVIGYTLQQLSFGVDMDNLDELGKEFLAELPADDYPDLALHVRQHMEPPTDDETEFGFGLRLILDGIERLHHSMSV
ncbi:MAG: TetR/AcrR family transcriptional regulator [bacterium]|nr:TetR/AcrR family transcriptional regulator [bacterium]